MNKSTLVLGASVNTSRFSNRAILKLRAHKIVTFAIGAKKGDVLDVVIETDKVAYDNLHTVTLYLNPTRQEAYYAYLLKLKPTRVIFNPGTENTTLMNLLRENAIEVEVACTLVLLNIGQY